MTREHLDITIRVYDEAVTVMCAGETRSIDINNWRYCEAQMVMFSCFIKNRYNDWYNQFVRPRINRTKPYIANQN
jgi:hypothetical protein